MDKQRGTLVLVVGPSGAGKDTLLSLARASLAGDERFVFPRRVVTRASGIGEDNEMLDEHAFAAGRDAGAFALHWEAHGLGYGIPASILNDLAQGRTVAVNVSRAVVAEAALRHEPILVCQIVAPRVLLEQRLQSRGRESDGDVRARLDRETQPHPAGIPAVIIMNDSRPKDACAELVSVLRGTQDQSSDCLSPRTGAP